jgi:hypothetical protein
VTEALEVAAVRERLRTDTVFWAQHCATILTEDKVPVRLVARPWQASFDAALEKQRAAGQPMRAIVLKARKLGFSTWVQAKFMQRVSQLPFQYALVAAQDRKTGGVLMDMARLMYDRLPTEEQLGLGFSIRPQPVGQGQTRSGSRWMSLGDKQRPTEASVYETLTAGSVSAGRGFTPSMLHGSEVAHWEDPAFLVGLLNAVPKTPETIVVLESTANGFNHFHTRWTRAVEGAEDPETGGLYAPLFYGWQDNPFNALPFPSDAARERFERTIGDADGGGDEEEEWLRHEFQVTLEQLRWRRVTIAEECGGDLELFHQEHPATAEQAFIGSGRPVFPALLVAKAIKRAESAPAPVEGVLRGVDVRERKTRSGSILIPQRAVWVPASQMTAEDMDKWPLGDRLLVWEHPVNAETESVKADHERKPDGQYVVFADVAEGAGTTSDDRDYSAIQVVDHMTRLQVARFRSRVPIHDLPLLVYLVGLYFNEAWVAVEKNALGIGVVDALAKDFRYRLMYRTRRPGDDPRGDAGGHAVGWATTPRTKPLMEQTFGQMLRAEEHGIRDVLTAREYSTYVEDPKNPAKHGAQKGAHDDLAMSFMGAHRVAAELRPRDPSKKRGAGRRMAGFDVSDPLTGG